MFLSPFLWFLIGESKSKTGSNNTETRETCGVLYWSWRIYCGEYSWCVSQKEIRRKGRMGGRILKSSPTYPFSYHRFSRATGDLDAESERPICYQKSKLWRRRNSTDYDALCHYGTCTTAPFTLCHHHEVFLSCRTFLVFSFHPNFLPHSMDALHVRSGLPKHLICEQHGNRFIFCFIVAYLVFTKYSIAI